jgi:hypothetical protein
MPATQAPPAREFSTAQIMERLAKHVEGAGGGVFGMALKESGEWVVSAEFGREAPDSPMVGGAAYGHGELRQALETAAADCGLLAKEQTYVIHATCHYVVKSKDDGRTESGESRPTISVQAVSEEEALEKAKAQQEERIGTDYWPVVSFSLAPELVKVAGE